MTDSAADTASSLIRAAGPDDVPAMLDIYAPLVRETVISFEYEPPSLDEMSRRLDEIQRGYPWLVYERGGVVAGYAYGSRFRGREAYQWTTEVTVYVHPAHHRRGVARALYEALFERLRAQGYRTAVAVITLPNPGSVALHEAVGFEPVGVFRRAGFKHGQWCDVGAWQLDLVDPDLPGPDAPPRAPASAGPGSDVRE
ncbi:arsinothricin resistance N-acetyltransferase ArsN1 family B [Haliangium sp.]|uniref:arsinothricin resistance N-acetyltransferase ArsN1 family B n=1 Tax=Haliangium sp. TaxID=2663208 RepID=UPI003D0E09FA